MCLPALLAVIPALVSAVSTVGGVAAGTGTFLGLSSTAWAGVGVASALAGTAATTVQQVQQGNQQEKIAEQNADLAQQQALDAQRRGSTAEAEHRTKLRQFMGSQRAQMGGSGVVVDQDSGGDVLADTAEYGERDAQRLRVNASREAWGYTSEAEIGRSQGRMAASAEYLKGGSTLLGGTMDAYRASPWWKRAYNTP